jgi:exonuclease III
MIFLSFNVRGLGGTQKKISLKRFILSLNPDVILIQETMCSLEKGRRVMGYGSRIGSSSHRCKGPIRGFNYRMGPCLQSHGDKIL